MARPDTKSDKRRTMKQSAEAVVLEESLRGFLLQDRHTHTHKHTKAEVSAKLDGNGAEAKHTGSDRGL